MQTLHQQSVDGIKKKKQIPIPVVRKSNCVTKKKKKKVLIAYLGAAFDAIVHFQ